MDVHIFLAATLLVCNGNFSYDLYHFGHTPLYYIDNQANMTRFMGEVSTIKVIAEISVHGARSGVHFMNAVNAFCRTWGTEMLPNDVCAAAPEFAAHTNGIRIQNNPNNPNIIAIIQGPCMDPDFQTALRTTSCSPL